MPTQSACPDCLGFLGGPRGAAGIEPDVDGVFGRLPVSNDDLGIVTTRLRLIVYHTRNVGQPSRLNLAMSMSASQPPDSCSRIVKPHSSIWVRIHLALGTFRGLISYVMKFHTALPTNLGAPGEC